MSSHIICTQNDHCDISKQTSAYHYFDNIYKGIYYINYCCFYFGGVHSSFPKM